MVVATSATDGQAEPGLAGGLEAIDDGFDEPFLSDVAALAIETGVAIEPGGDELIAGGIGQEIAGELVDGELVEGLIAIEGFDHPVAPGPHVAGTVGLKSIAVGVAGEVEPLGRHAFPITRGGEEAIDPFLVGIGRGVGEELLHLARGRRDAGQIEGNASNEGRARGLGRLVESFGFEPMNNELVDGIGESRRGGAYLGDRGTLGRDEGPMILVRGTLEDPTLEGGDLLWCQLLVELGRGHELLRIGMDDAFEQFTAVGLGGEDGDLAGFGRFKCRVLSIQAQAALAFLVIGAVTLKAGVGQDGADVPVEIEFGWAGNIRGLNRAAGLRGEQGREQGGSKRHRVRVQHRQDDAEVYREKSVRRP